MIVADVRRLDKGNTATPSVRVCANFRGFKLGRAPCRGRPALEARAGCPRHRRYAPAPAWAQSIVGARGCHLDAGRFSRTPARCLCKFSAIRRFRGPSCSACPRRGRRLCRWRMGQDQRQADACRGHPNLADVFAQERSDKCNWFRPEGGLGQISERHNGGTGRANAREDSFSRYPRRGGWAKRHDRLIEWRCAQKDESIDS